MLQVPVKLQEFHAYMFRHGDPEQQTKEAFFNGLHPEYSAMVVHCRDNLKTTIMELLTAMHECEENEENSRRNHHMEYAKAYPPSATRPTYGPVRGNDNRPPPAAQNPPHYARQDNCNNIPMHIAQVALGMQVQVEENYIPPYVNHNNPGHEKEDQELKFYTQYYTAAVWLGDDMEQ